MGEGAEGPLRQPRPLSVRVSQGGGMTAVFADTSYWIALLNPQDPLHSKATQLSTFLRRTRILTTEMVLVEFLNDFSGRGQNLRRAAVALGEDLRRAPHILI